MNNLKMLTRLEVSELLNTHIDTVSMLSELKILKPIKIGKCFMFSQDNIQRFQHDYEGLDLSNKLKALEAKKIVEARFNEQH